MATDSRTNDEEGSLPHTHKHYRFTGLPLWQAGFCSTLGMSIV